MKNKKDWHCFLLFGLFDTGWRDCRWHQDGTAAERDNPVKMIGCWAVSEHILSLSFSTYFFLVRQLLFGTEKQMINPDRQWREDTHKWNVRLMPIGLPVCAFFRRTPKCMYKGGERILTSIPFSIRVSAFFLYGDPRALWWILCRGFLASTIQIRLLLTRLSRHRAIVVTGRIVRTSS